MRTLLIAVIGLMLLLAGRGAFAQDQDNDLQPLMDRVTRLEHDIGILERQVYRGGGGGPVALTPGAGAGAAGDEVRSDQLGDQMRDLTGRVEELQHDISALNTRFDKMSRDVDMRLQALEQGRGGAPATAMNAPADQTPSESAAPPPPPEQAAAPPEQPQDETNAEPPAETSPPGEATAMNAPPPPPSAAEAGNLPEGSPQQQYDYAFGLLRDANYPAAERALRSFVSLYPNNSLSGNAQYWLGETYFVRGRFQAAAAAFAEGYQKFPRGAKAADDLLKLGSALARLGRENDACRSFSQLDRSFPIAPANLKQKEADEKRRAGCA